MKTSQRQISHNGGGQIDVLTGGFPCQPFSYAGQRRGERDDRYLWQEMLRAVQECRPTWVIGENVAGIITMVEQGKILEVGNQTSLFGEEDSIRSYELHERYTIERICKDLEGIGYSVQPILIPACAIGAPHRRDRVFIVAHSNCNDDERDSRTIRQEKREELLQEWHHLWQSRDASEVRQQSADSTQDSMRMGLQGRDEERQHTSLIRTSWATSNDGEIEWSSPHTDIGREGASREGGCSKRIRCHIDAEQSQRVTKTEWADGFPQFPQSHSNTDCNMLQGRHQEGRPKTESRCRLEALDREAQREHGEGYGLGARWRNFPSVSPIHRGNDGIPFDVDCLTIPFNKWRIEALKAYGNAIVPQVMYEIFLAIEEVEQSKLA